jgi:hypothetical protein
MNGAVSTGADIELCSEPAAQQKRDRQEDGNKAACHVAMLRILAQEVLHSNAGVSTQHGA